MIIDPKKYMSWSAVRFWIDIFTAKSAIDVDAFTRLICPEGITYYQLTQVLSIAEANEVYSLKILKNSSEIIAIGESLFRNYPKAHRFISLLSGKDAYEPGANINTFRLCEYIKNMDIFINRYFYILNCNNRNRYEHACTMIDKIDDIYGTDRFPVKASMSAIIDNTNSPEYNLIRLFIEGKITLVEFNRYLDEFNYRFTIIDNYVSVKNPIPFQKLIEFMIDHDNPYQMSMGEIVTMASTFLNQFNHVSKLLFLPSNQEEFRDALFTIIHPRFKQNYLQTENIVNRLNDWLSLNKNTSDYDDIILDFVQISNASINSYKACNDFINSGAQGLLTTYNSYRETILRIQKSIQASSDKDLSSSEMWKTFILGTGFLQCKSYDMIKNILSNGLEWMIGLLNDESIISHDCAINSGHVSTDNQSAGASEIDNDTSTNVTHIQVLGKEYKMVTYDIEGITPKEFYKFIELCMDIGFSNVFTILQSLNQVIDSKKESIDKLVSN